MLNHDEVLPVTIGVITAFRLTQKRHSLFPQTSHHDYSKATGFESTIVEKHIKCVVKNSANLKNQRLHSAMCHVHKQENVVTAEPYDCYKTTN